MGLLLILLILLILFGAAGIAIHLLWWLAIAILIVFLVSMAMGSRF